MSDKSDKGDLRRIDVDEEIEKVLADAPTIEGYTVKQLAEEIGAPWPTTRWHLELLEPRGGYYNIRPVYLRKK